MISILGIARNNSNILKELSAPQKYDLCLQKLCYALEDKFMPRRAMFAFYDYFLLYFN